MLERRDIAVILLWFLIFGLGKPFNNSLKPVLESALGRGDRTMGEKTRDRTAEYRAGGGVTIGAGSAALDPSSWHDLDSEPGGAAGRWAKTDAPLLLLSLPPGPEAPAYRIDLELESSAPLAAHLLLNGRRLAQIELSGTGMERVSLLADRDRLEVPGRNTLLFELPAGERPSLGFHAARVRPLPYLAEGRLSFRDDVYLWRGWSSAEAGFRWSDGPEAQIALPLRRVGSRPWRLTLGGTTGGPQRLGIEVNGHPAGSWELDGWDPQRLEVVLGPGRLQAGINQVTLRFPATRQSEEDPRRLGFALQWLRLERLHPHAAIEKEDLFPTAPEP